MIGTPQEDALFQNYSPAPPGTLLDSKALFTMTRFYRKIWNVKSPRYQTFGEQLLDTPYSARLIELVHRCLAYDPNDRPDVRILLREVNRSVNNYNSMNTEDVGRLGTPGIPIVHLGGDEPFVTLASLDPFHPDKMDIRRLRGPQGNRLPVNRRGIPRHCIIPPDPRPRGEHTIDLPSTATAPEQNEAASWGPGGLRALPQAPADLNLVFPHHNTLIPLHFLPPVIRPPYLNLPAPPAKWPRMVPQVKPRLNSSYRNR